MESMNKRCVFLEHVVSVIGSSNIQIVRGRAEVKHAHFISFNENFHLNISCFCLNLITFAYVLVVLEMQNAFNLC